DHEWSSKHPLKRRQVLLDTPDFNLALMRCVDLQCHVLRIDHTQVCILDEASMATVQMLSQAEQSTAHSALRADSSAVTPRSGSGPLGSCGIRAPFDHLPLVIDHPVGWVPDAPHLHLSLAVWTPEGITTCALRIPLPVGQAGDDLDRALDHALNLRQGRLYD